MCVCVKLIKLLLLSKEMVSFDLRYDMKLSPH